MKEDYDNSIIDFNCRMANRNFANCFSFDKASWNIINIEKSSSVKCEIHLPIWGAFAPVEIGILIYTNFKTMYSNINILSYIKIIIIINILNLRCNASITKAIKIKHLKINYNFIQWRQTG